MLFGELFTFLSAYSSSVSKIALVTNKHNRHIGICMLPCVLQPTSQVIESLSPEQYNKQYCEVQTLNLDMSV